jgi:uncharacterized protein YjiS (DUF1127 family)
MIMSTTLCTPAAEGRRAPRSALKTWWMAYLTRRIERVAILQLEAMSDRQLEDIGLTRSHIQSAMRGNVDPAPKANFEPILNPNRTR